MDVCGQSRAGIDRCGEPHRSRRSGASAASLGASYFEETGDEGTTDEIRADWNAIKQSGAAWRAAESLTKLRITEEGCKRLVEKKADEFESYLTSHVAAFANMGNWPADAQLGLMSMAWPMGPAFADGNRWPNFRGACANEDWLAAAANCNMSNAWLTKRNAVNRGLFRNAAYAVAQDDFDASILWLPIEVSRPYLNLGDSNSENVTYVRKHSFLNWLRYPTKEMGLFDDQTLDQVKAFQRDEGFPTTGTIGPLTWLHSATKSRPTDKVTRPVKGPAIARPLIQLGCTGPHVLEAKLRLNLAGVSP